MSRVARRRPVAALQPGAVVRDRYRVEAKLGEGGMAEVYRAFDIASGRRVALKVLHPDVATNPEAVERTKREGELLSRLDNPAIVNVETFGELDDGAVFLVMELLEGETLGDRMRRGPLDPQELAPIVAGTCAGLHAAHSHQIIHRDLKPDNIYLCPTDTGIQVKLLDFGIAKLGGGKRLTQTGEVLGTPRYMSPEQLGAEHDVDGRVDIYALGVILYEALAGKPPFLASTPTDLIIAILNGKVAPLRAARPDVPEAVEAVVMRAMSKVRHARFDNPMQLAEAYIDAVGGVAAVRQMQRRGMPTRAFGGKIEDLVPGTNPPPATPDAEVAGKLRLGTFSGLPQMDVPIAPPGKRRPIPETGAGTREMGASPGGEGAAPAPEPVEIAPSEDAPAARTRAARTRDVPETRELTLGAIPDTPVPDTPVPATPRPTPAPRRSVAATEMMDRSSAGMTPAPPAPSVSMPPRLTEPPKPSLLGRILLVLGALLAGAASAGLVIVALMWSEGGDAEERPATSPAVVPEPAPPPTDAAVDAGLAAGPTPSEEATAAPDPTPPVAEAEADPTPRRRRSRRERADPTGPTLPGFGDLTAPPDPNREALREARQALNEGDPARCVSILDRAMQSGAPVVALRRRGECYDRMGRRDAAIQDYQRFCRVAADNPALPEVRALLESWGQRCP